MSIFISVHDEREIIGPDYVTGADTARILFENGDSNCCYE